MKTLIKELAKREGKKSQVKVGDIREVLSKLADILTDTGDGPIKIRQELVDYLGIKLEKKYVGKWQAMLLCCRSDAPTIKKKQK